MNFLKKVFRIVSLVVVLVSSPLLVYYASRTGSEKYLAAFFLLLILTSMCVYALIDVSTSEIEPNNAQRSLMEFEKNREYELEHLLIRLDVTRTNFNNAIKNGDKKNISDAEKALDADLTSLLDFFENYSNFGKTIHQNRSKKNS